MKFRWFLASLVFLGLFTQCTKQASETMSSEVRLMEQDTSPTFRAKQGPEIEWMLYCEGQCEECKGKGVKLRPQVYECPCTEECSLKIVRVGDQPGNALQGEYHNRAKRSIDSLSNLYGTFQANVETSLRSRYGLEDYRIMAVEVYATAESYACKYHIQSDDWDQEISLSYIKEALDEPGYEIDCNGGCISASAKCTERVKLGSPIQIECTCEGDCKMDVTPTKENLE